MDGITEGMTVYDSAGEKVGTVREYNAQDGYLDVQKGFLFHKDIYIPASTVSRNDQDGVYLSLHKDDLSGDTYSQPPAAGYGAVGAASATQTTGYDTTTTSGVEQTTRTTRTTSAAANTGETAGAGDIRVPVYEEELVVGKRQEEEGRVHLRKEVVTEQESIPVTLQREQVTVERVPMGTEVDLGATRDAFTGADIDVPVMGEEAVVGKTVRAVEEVRLHKDIVNEQEQVTDTVRKERVVVDGVEQSGASATTTTNAINDQSVAYDDTTRRQ